MGESESDTAKVNYGFKVIGPNLSDNVLDAFCSQQNDYNRRYHYRQNHAPQPSFRVRRYRTKTSEPEQQITDCKQRKEQS